MIETAFAIDDRGIEILASTLDQIREAGALKPEERDAIFGFRDAVRGLKAQAEGLSKAGHLTRDGIDAEMRAKVAAIAPRIDAFERAADDEFAMLQKTRALIERGAIVRGTSDAFEPVVRRSNRTPVEAIIAGEIRSTVRGMTADERRALILKAFDEGDTETLDAIETAPASLPVMDDMTRRTLAEKRWQRAGWKAMYEQKIGAVSLRRRVAEAAREALGLTAKK